jgi:hypothetical protein
MPDYDLKAHCSTQLTVSHSMLTSYSVLLIQLTFASFLSVANVEKEKPLLIHHRQKFLINKFDLLQVRPDKVT